VAVEKLDISEIRANSGIENVQAIRALVGMALLQLKRNGALFGVHGIVSLEKCLTLPALLERRCYASNPQFPVCRPHIQYDGISTGLDVKGTLNLGQG
jgi:hypothetical protein